MARLNVAWAGLECSEAEERLARVGANATSDSKTRPAWLRFLLQFRSVLLYALMGSAAVTAVLGYWTDSCVILGVVLINAIIGFVQEDHAERALSGIRELMSPSSRVIRGGNPLIVDSRTLVPGDILLLREGDRIGADCRLLKTNGLQTDESMLTGESFPVDKSPACCPAETDLADRACIAFAGTLVVSGHARAAVIETADRTELGKITTSLNEAQAPPAPIIVQMSRFASVMTIALLALSAALLAFAALVRKMQPAEALLATIAFAVGAIPEGLPAILTITLAAGVGRMAKRRAIVRRLPAVETLAAVTVIGSDKTGTLTRNELLVTEWVTATGTFQSNIEDSEAALAALVRSSVLCTDIEPDRTDAVRGNPIDVAIAKSAAALGIARDRLDEASTISILPFGSAHKFMAVLLKDGNFGATLIVKGAPEEIIERCKTQLSASGIAPIQKEYWLRRLNTLVRDARRVIAVASVAWPKEHDKLEVSAIAARRDLTLIGLLSLSDPPRDGVRDAIEIARRAGIEVKLITGDHPGTARAIGREIRIAELGRIVIGSDIEGLDDASLRELIREANIFARTAPHHKLRLVKALQESGAIVAMTGDGVNDAPALKTADIGIAMGRRGSEAAKQAAEIVLSDDNFATITAAIEEGRTVFDNLRKAMIYVLPTNIAQGLIILVAILFGIQIPLTPLQVLWVNMVTAVALSIPFALERPEADVMKRPPSYFASELMSAFVAWRIVFVAALLLALVLIQFNFAVEVGASIEAARSIALNTLIIGEIAYLFNVRKLSASSLTFGTFIENPAALYGVLAVVVAQVAVTEIPFLQHVLGTAPLSPSQWGSIALAGLAMFLMVEAEKAILARRPLTAGTAYTARAAARKI